MGKTIFINMNDVKIKGDILDMSSENSGIIYNISKDVEEEICVDYVTSENKSVLDERKYDACTFVFNFNNILGNRRKAKVIKDVVKYLKEDGEIYVWDVNKEGGRFINYKINIALPHGEIKKAILKNYNPIATCSINEIRKILEKYCEIREAKVWEDVFFIKAIKNKSQHREELKNENIINSNKLKVHS
ncbi:MAG: hypothetical protein K5986_07905 [Clostridium sp.]|uniref:hypothetical protein n=1 Tax=Clostridium sp. DSM 8431 TaxID=1761781 RepID=UPI0008EEB924|nr:hypothetical protein [Clostridium sp. DSM 8431]MCR4944356.1 hypothetical protein [Clostridium sp.]SFU43336.1 hypothetical protein SAMN04487886_102613 [Clostridium sp. DSM 8431]